MDWRYVTGHLGEFVPAPWLQIGLAISAALCGAIVGAEREKREKPAGLRTLVLVCLGSAAFTMVSYAFVTTTGDSGRVAAQIVTGIGFLGAGAILHSSGIVRGMTTAATIWATAATGMIVGTGHVGAGLGLSLLVRLVLSVALALESRAWGDVHEGRVELRFQSLGGKTRLHIEKVMEEFHQHRALDVVGLGETTMCQATIPFRLSRRHRREFLNELAGLPGVEAIAERTA
ncbi:MAG: MgtC/SapB family protein [Verrucomicrobia bacterium]|jgi:putative Mg2+ transporter-C (MgtC) family protein|nr:MgtC/SapB family protein [Verrucomicrobiota bacterium]